MSGLARPVSLSLILPSLTATPSLRSNARRCLSFSIRRLSARHRSPALNSGAEGYYDPDEPLRGPLHDNPPYPRPEFYPKDLKERVDQYVVGQERAKRTICSTIFNHYQNIRRREYLEEKRRKALEKLERQTHERAFESYNKPHEGAIGEDANQFHGETATQEPEKFLAAEDDTLGVKIDKSNLLLVGPTGVGKTYILETLSKTLRVPFTIADCNSFTQAGYIGQDVETCIERLLIEANYDIVATERGIIVLDEFDKIAKRETMNGRDVGGEGVQQALLKLVEGTKVTINIKDNKSSRNTPPTTSTFSSSGPANSSSQAGSPPPPPPPLGKIEQYTIDTSNILFVFCGAFVGLDRAVIRRVAKPSMGFGSELKGTVSMSGSKQALPQEMYSHLPHQPQRGQASTFTPLDLTAPADLQAFGFIPELIGRVHNICALSPLSRDDLFRILTEPRNSLVAQYKELFSTYQSSLEFTNKALTAIAERAVKSETGARGLKMEMERVLAEPMFMAEPKKYVLITEASVGGAEMALIWGRDGMMEWQRRKAEEDEETVEPKPLTSLGDLRKVEYALGGQQAGASGA